MWSCLSGWGRNLSSLTLLKEFSEFNLSTVVSRERGAIPRGLGRSYGDSAANSGGLTIDCSKLKSISIDSESKIATVLAGVTLGELEIESLRFGMFPSVVPGTGYVTIGGAIASDIHGKSHHRVGSFSNQIVEMKILTSDGRETILQPTGDTAKYFWATVGGMGLTGIILEVKIRLQSVETGFVVVEEKRAQDLDHVLELLKLFNDKYLYTVAWIDLSGKFNGRGIVSGANHANKLDVPMRMISDKPYKRKNFRLPSWWKFRVIYNITTQLFNSFWFYKPLGKKFQHIIKYMHPLDGIENWNSVYGTKGFVQYQFVIPFEKKEVLKSILSVLRKSKSNSFLTVLKSLGESPESLIGFPMRGWTLAIDLPAHGPSVSLVLEQLDDLVLNAGGRIYLTKDSRMNSHHIRAMYPRLDEWRNTKTEMDPDNFWQSDQSRRLKLC